VERLEYPPVASRNQKLTSRSRLDLAKALGFLVETLPKRCTTTRFSQSVYNEPVYNEPVTIPKGNATPGLYAMRDLRGDRFT